MAKIRVLLTFVLIATFALLIGPVHAQNNSKVLRIATTSEPPVLIDYWDPGPAFTPMRIIMQPQWSINADGTIVPTLVDALPSAENGGVAQTADGKSIIKFKLADWAMWSDGQPIVADDFKLVYDVANDSVSDLRPFRFFNSVKVDSIAQGATDKDVIISFGQAQSNWSRAWIVPLPAHLLRKPYEAALKDHKDMDTLDYLRAPTVGDGPFVFAEWKPGQYIRFTRNTHFHKPLFFDELVLSFYPDINVIKQLLASGDTDMTFDIPFLDAADLVKQNPNTLQVQNSFSGGRNTFEFNLGSNGFAALKDANVRKAIEMGINRQYIVDTLYNGKTKVPRSYWDDTLWYFKGTPYIAYDPAGAKAQLKQAGWYDDTGDGVVKAHGVTGVPDGTPFVIRGGTIGGSTWSTLQDTLLAIQDMLGKIGVKVGTINTYDVTIFVAGLKADGKMATGSDDVYSTAWGVGTDTIDQYRLYSCDAIPTEQNPGGLNFMRICNPAMDKLWDVLGTSMSADERQTAANQIQTIMADQVLTIYIANRYDATVLNKSIQGFFWGGLAGNPLIALPDTKRAN